MPWSSVICLIMGDNRHSETLLGMCEEFSLTLGVDDETLSCRSSCSVFNLSVLNFSAAPYFYGDKGADSSSQISE